MANPWDPDNIRPNLKTLSQIEKDDKISILPTGRIDRHHYFPNLGRSGKDSMIHLAKSGNLNGEEDEQLDSITRLFKAAVTMSKAGGLWSLRDEGERPTHFVSKAEITAALKGLTTLLESYPSGKKAAQRMGLVGIIDAVKLQLPADPKFPEGYSREEYFEAKEEFKKDYKTYHKLAMQQNDYTLYQQKGVCHGMCLDWIRRCLLKSKTSYAQSSKWSPGSLEDRLQSKAVKHMHDAQHDMNHGDQSIKTIAKRDTGFANLTEGRLIRGDWGIPDLGPSTYTFGKKDDLFRTIFDAAYKAIEEVYFEQYKAGKAVCFRLSLRPDLSVSRFGHSLAFDFRSFVGTPHLYLFDPNYGEFAFAVSSEKEQEVLFAFFGRLWMLYAMQSAIFVSWGLIPYHHS